MGEVAHKDVPGQPAGTDHIRKLFNKLHPLSMSLIKLALAFQIFKGLVITMFHKFLWKKIMLPILQSSNKSIKFFIISGVINMTPFEFLTKISYGGITFYFKCLSKVRKG